MNYSGITCIYAILNNVNSNLYIGSAINLKKRIAKHLNRLRGNHHHSPILQNAWNKHGEKSFTFEIIEIIGEAKSRNDLVEPEQKWINFFNPKYNICRFANSMLGFRHSIESRKKQSIAAKGKPKPHLRGRKMPQYAVEINRIRNTGKRYSEETNKKKSRPGTANPYYGKTHTEEIRAKMKEGRKRFNERKPKKTIYQYDGSVNLVTTYHGLDDLVSKTGYSKRAIACAISVKKHLYRGYFWSYTPFDKNLLPEFMRKHPLYNK